MGEVIRIATLQDQFEVQLLEAFLKEQGIDYALQSFHDTAFDGLFQAEFGWGTVEADEDCADVINGFLADLRKEKKEASDGEALGGAGVSGADEA